jgi:hypothetical protein
MYAAGHLFGEILIVAIVLAVVWQMIRGRNRNP